MSLEFIPITYPDCKLVCLIHSEAKQTKMLEFGAEKELLQGIEGSGTSLPLLQPLHDVPGSQAL